MTWGKRRLSKCSRARWVHVWELSLGWGEGKVCKSVRHKKGYNGCQGMEESKRSDLSLGEALRARRSLSLDWSAKSGPANTSVC